MIHFLNYIENHPKIALLLILGVTTLSWGWGIYESGIAFPDEAVHLMDGVFVMDALTDTPISNAMEWAKAYYYQYPAVTFGYYYPPIFAVAEAFMFKVFGISEQIGRMTVLIFGFIGVIALFSVISRYIGRISSFYICSLFATQPLVAYWARQVMLEIPAISMAIISFGFLLSYIKNANKIAYFGWIFSGIATVFTKQNTIFVLISYLFLICFWGKRPFSNNKKFWLGWVCIAIPTCIYVYWDANYVPMHRLANLDPVLNPNPVDRLFHNFTLMFSHFSVMSSAAIIGILIALYFKRWNSLRLGMSWTLPLLGMMMLIPRSDPRFLILGVPGLAFFASSIGEDLNNRSKTFGNTIVVLISIFILIQIVQTLRIEVTFLRGQDEIAKKAISSTRSKKIFYDGHFDTGFVFFVRKNDPTRSITVYRGSKVLYSAIVFKDLQLKNLVNSEEQIQELITKLKVDPIIVEEKEQEMTKASKLLRSLLSRTEFNKNYETLLVRNKKILTPISFYSVPKLYEGEAYRPSLPMGGIGSNIDPPKK
jgi:hypothetical protein